MKTEFIKTIKRLSNRFHTWQVFSDFCEIAAIALYNSIAKDADREQQYLNIIKRYNKEEIALFPKLLSITVEALEQDSHDFIGSVFGELELHNKWAGQYFTPQDVCDLMAGLMVGPEVKEQIKKQGFITLSEPACGAGAMVIGFTKAMIMAGLNPQQQLHVTAVDVSAVAAHMTYIQLTLLHIPAIVVIGNTLTLEERDHLLTPAHMMGLWDWKLHRNKGDKALLNPTMETPYPMPAVEQEQMVLFG